jgi:crotonobetainyl-CoA:carnitine CoA-transferase CaiB-like acyl-CoA transferase
MLSYHLTSYFASGRVPIRRGAGSQLSVPYQAFKAKDEWVVVAAFTERMWQGVCNALRKPEWAVDERFCVSDRRAANRDILIPMLEEAFAQESVDHWVAELGKEGVPCSAVNAIDRVVVDEQVLARDMVVQIEHPDSGLLKMAGLPIKLSDNPGEIRRHPPNLGEHSVEVLREMGVSEQKINELIDTGVLYIDKKVSA